MAVKEILCPHCKKPLALSDGFYHDESFNLFCSYCNGIVFAASKQMEDKHKAALRGGHCMDGSISWSTRKDCLPIKINTLTTPTPTTQEVIKNMNEQ